MPLYKTIQVDASTMVLIWKITEPFTDLLYGVSLRDTCLERLKAMKSESHKKGFLSIRKLLTQVGYTDFDLFYNKNGKPTLKDGKHISITHSFDFSAIVISDKNVGIDIEQQREKIIKIASKFTTETEQIIANTYDPTKAIRLLTIIWGIKEAIYKFYSTKGLSLKNHIRVFPFGLEEKNIHVLVNYQNASQEHQAKFIEFESYTLVYLIPNRIPFKKSS